MGKIDLENEVGGDIIKQHIPVDPLYASDRAPFQFRRERARDREASEDCTKHMRTLSITHVTLLMACIPTEDSIY